MRDKLEQVSLIGYVEDFKGLIHQFTGRIDKKIETRLAQEEERQRQRQPQQQLMTVN